MSHRSPRKPITAVPLKFVTEGQNLDVANSILQAEQLTKKSSPKKPSKLGNRSSKRRSASIERIFDKKKPEDMSPQVKQLQAQLSVLKQREHQLRMPHAGWAAVGGPPGLPPPPPPPPPSLLPPPPPPPPRTPMSPIRTKPSTDWSMQSPPPGPKPWLKQSSPALAICASGAEIQEMLRNLRKVGPAVPPSPPPTQPPEPMQLPELAPPQLPETPEATEATPIHPQLDESLLKESLSLVEILAHRREMLAPDSSDESIDQSESTEF